MSTHTQSTYPRPGVICLSGLDPTGGAGIQADIEAVMQTGGHCLPIITSLTVQNTSNVLHTEAVGAKMVRHQLDTVYDDVPVAAVKIGLLNDSTVLQTIVEWLQQHPHIPVVADPVLKAGGGFQFENEFLVSNYCRLLLPLADIVTPNTDELQRLTAETDHDRAAAKLLATGCRHVLVTGTHDDSEHVVNRLYARAEGDTQATSLPADTVQPIRSWQWPRLPGSFHGSGCTLASALASLLATGHELTQATELAQQFTWRALVRATRLGKGQFVPDRRTAGAEYLDYPAVETRSGEPSE